MVAGRLQEKSGYFYVVLSYKDNNGVRKQPWFRTGLKIRGNKKNAEKILLYYRMNFDIQSGKLNCIKYGNPEKQMNMLFGDYLLLWLEEIKLRSRKRRMQVIGTTLKIPLHHISTRKA